ncbi:MAG TPA: extracellular solute-binding protein [Armatimonadota bacterium]|jgi:multiple sugar transport system permease protein
MIVERLRSLALPALLVALLVAWAWLERPPEQRPGKVVLRWVVNSMERDQVFARAIKVAFEARNPDIVIQFIKSNEGSKVDTMIAGGDAPDILTVGTDSVYYYIEARALRDLSTLMSPQERRELAGYYPVTLAPFQRGSRLYARPWGFVPFILYCNRALFRKYGVPYPNDRWTWDDYRNAARLLTHDVDHDGFLDEFGCSYAQWHDGYYCWAFQNGGRVLVKAATGDRLTFSDPRTVAAIRFLQRLTRDDRVVPTRDNAPKQAASDLFRTGQLGIQGPTGSFFIPLFRQFQDLDWDIAPIPRGPAGRAAIVAPIGFSVSTQSRHPREAYRLVKYLTGPEGERVLARSGLFVPSLRSVASNLDLLRAGGPRPHNVRALISSVEEGWARVPPWSGRRWADVIGVINRRMGDLLVAKPLAGETPDSVARDIDREANAILKETREERRGVPMPWRVLELSAGLLIGLGGVWWLRVVLRAARRSRQQRSEEAWGYAAIAPWLVGFLVFGLGPLLFSVVLSLGRWQSLAPPETARFVGLEHFHTLLTGRDPYFLRALTATGLYTLLSVPLGLVLGLALALLMNTSLKGITVFRTLYYLPAVLPAVAVTVLWWWLFRPAGLLNYLLSGFGTLPLQRMPDWLNDPQYTLPAIVLMGLWGVGGGMMIYLAGLQSIPTQLYDAAQVDGAGPWDTFRVVTLPMLSPVLLFNLVMGIIGSFQVFTGAFVLFGGEGGPRDSALFYSVYLYRKAFTQFDPGYGSALAWILFAIVLAFTALVFRSSSLWVYYEGAKDRD